MYSGVSGVSVAHCLLIPSNRRPRREWSPGWGTAGDSAKSGSWTTCHTQLFKIVCTLFSVCCGASLAARRRTATRSWRFFQVWTSRRGCYRRCSVLTQPCFIVGIVLAVGRSCGLLPGSAVQSARDSDSRTQIYGELEVTMTNQR